MKLKNYLLAALALAGTLFTTTSCDQLAEQLVPKFQIEQDGTPVTSLTIDAEAEEVAMTVVSNLSWALASDVDWLVIEPASYTNTTGLEAKTDIALKVLENTGETSRVANITATVEDISFKLIVTQSVKGGSQDETHIAITDEKGNAITELAVPVDGGEMKFNIVSNWSWLIDYDADWLKIVNNGIQNEEHAELTTAVTIVVEANAAPSARETILTANAGSNASATLTIKQAGTDGPEPSTTIADVINGEQGAEYTVEKVVIAGVNARSVLLTDGTDYILAYFGSTPAYADENVAVVGDIVTVTGKSALYSGLIQFGQCSIAKTGIDSTFTYPEPKKMEIADFTAFAEKPVIEYVTYEGMLAISGNYYNIIIDGLDNIQGSIAYPIDGQFAADMNGKILRVTGYTIGFSNSKYVSTLVTEIAATGDAVYTETTIKNITAEGNYIVKNAIVGGLYQRGYVVFDENKSAILVYLGAEAKYDVKMFDVVNLKGTVSTFNGNLQFGETTTAEIVGNNVVEYELPEITAADIEAYESGYFAGKVTGELSVNDTYYNVKINGTEIVGSISYPLETLELKQLDKQTVTIEGWSLSKNTSKEAGVTYFNMLAVNVYAAEVPPVTDITPIINVKDGQKYLMEGVVTALSTNGFILTDNTASIFCYKNEEKVALGNKVKVEGTIGNFNCGLQIQGASAKITVEDTVELVYPTPTAINGAAMDAAVADTSMRLAQYVTLTGKLTISGNFYNVKVQEGDKSTCCSYYITEDLKALAPADGSTVTVKGFFVSVNNNNFYYNVIYTSIEKVEAPEPAYSITLTPNELLWEAEAKGNQTIEVSVTDASDNACKDWTVKLDSEEWFQIIGHDTEAGTITVAPQRVNDSGLEQCGILTVTVGTEYATASLTHLKPAVITPICDVVLDGTYTMQGVVLALTTNGFILGDETATIFCYKNTTTVAIGDQVTVFGAITAYNKGLQIDGAKATITVTGTTIPAYPEAKTADAAAVDAFVADTANRLATYVALTGTVSVSGNYYNIKIDGTTNEGSVYYATDATKALLKNGANVTVKGYAIAVTGGKYYNIIVVDVVENAAPESVSVSPESHEWAADDLTAKEFNVTASSEWAYTLSEGLADWLTVSVAGNVITATPKAANTATTANKGTINLSCGVATASIAVTQAGATVAGEQVIYNATFNNSGEYTTNNNYGADPKTYTVSGVVWTVVYADIVSSGTPIDGTANIMARIAKDVTTSPSATTASLVSTDTKLTKLTYKYNAKATGLNFLSEYSLDGGTTWVEVEKVTGVTTGAVAKEFAFDGLTASKDIRLRFTVSTDKATSSKRDFQIDDVVVYGVK